MKNSSAQITHTRWRCLSSVERGDPPWGGTWGRSPPGGLQDAVGAWLALIEVVGIRPPPGCRRLSGRAPMSDGGPDRDPAWRSSAPVAVTRAAVVLFMFTTTTALSRPRRQVLAHRTPGRHWPGPPGRRPRSGSSRDPSRPGRPAPTIKNAGLGPQGDGVQLLPSTRHTEQRCHGTPLRHVDHDHSPAFCGQRRGEQGDRQRTGLSTPRPPPP